MSLALPNSQRRPIGRHRLLQPSHPALPLAKRLERVAEIVLDHRPAERNPLARTFLQRRLIGLDGAAQRGVVAALVALPIESVSLIQQILGACGRMSTWNRPAASS